LENARFWKREFHKIFDSPQSIGAIFSVADVSGIEMMLANECESISSVWHSA